MIFAMSEFPASSQLEPAPVGIHDDRCTSAIIEVKFTNGIHYAPPCYRIATQQGPNREALWSIGKRIYKRPRTPGSILKRCQIP